MGIISTIGLVLVSLLPQSASEATQDIQGFVLLHPHLTNPEARSIVLSGTDWEGTERAIRLFPYRTGVSIPDFAIIGQGADKGGAGGVLAAG